MGRACGRKPERNTGDGDHSQTFRRTRGLGEGVERTHVYKLTGESQSAGWRREWREEGKGEERELESLSR